MSMTPFDHASLVINGAKRRLGLRHDKGIVPFFDDLKVIGERFRQSSPLHSAFFQESDAAAQHKWLHYLDIYEENLSIYRDTTPLEYSRLASREAALWPCGENILGKKQLSTASISIPDASSSTSNTPKLELGRKRTQAS